MKISRKVALVYLLTLVPLIVLGLLLLYQWYDSHLNVIEVDRINNARLVATAFETFIRDLSGSSQAIGEATLNDPPPTSTPAQFTVMANTFPLHFSAVVDREGRIIYANDTKLIGEVLDDDAIERARAGAALAIGETRLHDGKVGFMLAQALHSPEGEVAGMAVQYVDPQRLARRLARNRISGGGASIVDSAGTLVVLFEDPEVGDKRLYWGDFPVVKGALEGRETIDRNWIFPIDGKRRIAAGVPIGQLGWEASSAAPYASSVAPFRRSLTIAISIGVLTLIISGSAAGILGRSLIGSVSALRDQSLTVGKRDAEPVDIVRSGDELEEVSRALRQSDFELRSYIAGLEAIGEAGRMLSVAIGEGDVDDAIIDAAKSLFAAHAVWVSLYDERSDRLEMAVWYSSQGHTAPELSLRPGQGVAGRVFMRGEVAVVPDVSADPDLKDADLALSHGIESLAEIPLERAGRPFGVLGISAPEVAQWKVGGREIALLRAFGNEVTTVLENARLYENERFIADTLQQSLLTIPERVPGLTFSDSYSAATQTARVGGDFYDIFELDERVGIVMGDVAGHGLDAAVLTSLVKNAVRAHADEPGKSPAEVVELTNELIVKESRPDAFVTLFVAELERSSGRFTYCNAGHTTAALMRTDGSVESLPSTSMLVGAFSGVTFEQITIDMGVGDTLVLYTDGLTEARRKRELYGETRLFDLLRGLETREPGVVLRAMIDEVLDYTGGELSDDLAVLTVQRCEFAMAYRG